MRTFKFTHEQIELITQALGIAEVAYTDIQKEIINKLVIIRGNNETKHQEEVALHYHKQACLFADLNVGIQNSEFDI